MDATHKKCTKCDQVKPLSDYYYVSTRSTYHSCCKVCQTAQSSAIASAKAAKRRAERNRLLDERTEKACTICGETKPLDAFYQKKGTRDGRAPHCSECDRRNVSEYYAKNYDAVRERQKAWRARKVVDDPEWARRTAERAERYRNSPEGKATKARWQAVNADKLSVYLDGYRRENPHKQWEGCYRYRAKKFGFEAVVEPFTREELIAEYGDACFYCGGAFEQLDHYVPVARGGSHTLENARPSCAKCNRDKFDALPSDLGIADD